MKKIILLLLLIISISYLQATTCTLSGNYNNTSQMQSALNTCGANDTIKFTGTASWAGSITIGPGQYLIIAGTITLTGTSAITSSTNNIYVAPTGTFVTNNNAVIINGTTMTNLGTVTGPKTITSAGILPVKLISFVVKSENSYIVLDWVTASEYINKGFEIERSDDAIEFKKIGFVDGNGTTSDRKFYKFIDKNPMKGYNYYRLKQLDLNENFEYFKIVAINKSDVEFYVNMTSVDESIKIHATMPGNYAIYDIVGKEVKSGVLDTETQINSKELVNGRYFFVFESEKGEKRHLSYMLWN